MENEISALGLQDIDPQNSLSRLKITVQDPPQASVRTFADLPTEVRLLIWGFAFAEPQIHTVSSYNRRVRSRSRLNAVMQTCKESRDEGKRLKLPYFRVFNPEISGGCNPEIINYMTRNDIIWLKDGFTHEFNNIRFYCPECSDCVQRGVLTESPRGLPGRLTCGIHG